MNTHARSAFVPFTAARRVLALLLTLSLAWLVAGTADPAHGDAASAASSRGPATGPLAQQEPPREPRFVPEKPEYTEIGEGFSRERAHLKFMQDTQVRLRDGEFVSEGEDDLSEIHDVLADYPDVAASRLFDARSEAELAREKERIERQSGREQGDKNLYYELIFPETTDAVALLNDLNDLAIVEIAYPEPLEGVDPTMHTPDFRPQQGYREAAPDGIHADLAATAAGGRGDNVQIIDIERFFNPTHEDLPTVTVYPNGDPGTDAFDHGTAVLGAMFGVDNGFGVLGLADQADAGFVPTAGGRPNAIDLATANSAAGDVILLELQRGGPNGSCSNGSTPPQVNCTPEEWSQASYDAIVAATSTGIIVVAAAGNGREDLDAPEFDPAFVDRPDSGAIMVGAGGAPGCSATPRGRLAFSNFGSRVNVQGWGQCVATTGYGSLQGSSGSDDAYTATFSGTSSASPVVAGAAAILSSIAIEEGDADGLSSTEARSILMATGTPQDTSPAALDGNIGPLPNLGAALDLLADLEHISVTLVNPPSEIDVNTPVPLTVRHTVVNHGPIEQVDADLTTLVTAPPDCDVVPAVTDETVALTKDAVTTVDTDVTLTCSEPSFHDVHVDAWIAAPHPGQDPDPSNNASDHAETIAVIARADLAVLDLDLAELDAAVLGDLLVGQPFEFEAPLTLHNFGDTVGGLYNSPVDAEVSRTLTVPDGVIGSVEVSGDEAPATVVVEPDGQPPVVHANQPAGSVVEVPGPATLAVHAATTSLAVGADHVIDTGFGLGCAAPGSHDVSFTASVEPTDEHVLDPDSTNDTLQEDRTIECVTPVQINIRPGNAKNFVNPGSQQKVPVAVLTTEAGEYGLPLDFDATAVDHTTARFGTVATLAGGNGSAPSPNKAFIRDSFEMDDKTKDGDVDMVLRFPISGSGISADTTQACVTGTYLGADANVYTFVGCDVVQPKP